MPSAQLKIKTEAQSFPPAQKVFIGPITRIESARLILQGAQHIHSTPNVMNDPLALQTQNWIQSSNHSSRRYSWEPAFPQFASTLRSSHRRKAAIEEITEHLAPYTSSSLKENIQLIFEELFTNALYHGYRKLGICPETRTDRVELSSPLRIDFQYHGTPEGIYFSVTDHGGALTFSDFQRSLNRCYFQKEMIEAKPTGAGLGLYFIFETATHLKIRSKAGKMTQVSGWVSKRHLSPDFSFNFFSLG